MQGSTIVTNEMLYPLLHNLPGVGEVISTEALMTLDINHDQKSLKNLGELCIFFYKYLVILIFSPSFTGHNNVHLLSFLSSYMSLLTVIRSVILFKKKNFNFNYFYCRNYLGHYC